MVAMVTVVAMVLLHGHCGTAGGCYGVGLGSLGLILYSTGGLEL